ncbi:nucleolar protein 14-like [Dendronephthya gigantea]|uniref:nucleolar protein 14-like n=1 Tax=Dendronephthya gigantea TaxID=151771 RepID=UPI00106C8DB3|nr:nucleolar protein 14-like [Dendronephthya gigantea]
MAKHKRKAKRAAHAFTKNEAKEGKENPFEVRINKRRYDILGQKVKHDKGNPGISRSRGLKKREKTLLVEYKQRHKANTFIDKRFGEYDEQLSLEEKMLKRFATEKQKHHEKSHLFNLEDEELTHFGQSLGDIKHFDGPVLSDDEKDDNDYKDEYHFGGFLKKKSQDIGKDGNEPRSKKEIMEEVVANAKIKKHERQQAKEEMDTVRQKLDEGLDDIRSLLKFRADGNEQERKQKADDYDITVREMAFEVKAQASDKLKTEEQLAKMEEERLKKLESDRIRRMKGLPREEKKPTHVSADDLVDCYTVDVDNRSMLTYEEGRMVLPDGYEENLEMQENDEQDEDPDDNDKNDDEEEDSYHSDEVDSDIESSDSEDSEEETKEVKSAQTDKTHLRTMSNDVTKTRKTSETTEDTLPYTFKAPGSYEEFYKLVRERSTSDVVKIVERIQKCNHPKLNPHNKKKMEVFFDILVKYVDDLVFATTPKLNVVDSLVCHLFDLAQHSPLHTAKTMQNKLKEIQKRFCELSRKHKVPDLQTVIFLRIVSVLFPTSDFRHGVCTPALIFMAQILSQITVQSTRDALIGLFVCNLVYEFVHSSKRYVPEVINYFIGILYLSSEKTQPAGKIFPPFKSRSKHRDILKISSDTTISNVSKPVSLHSIFSCDVEEDDISRNTALHTCLVLLKRFVTLYSDLVSFPEIFQPVAQHMKNITISKYSLAVQELQSEILKSITSHEINRQPLAMQTRRPTPIQMFEPKFDEQYEVKRKRSSGNKNINERQKLRYKHKKEFKGALREIRKDSQFLARQQLKEQLQRDAERAQKTKQIQAMLSNQQAEANEFNRKKRKKRN